MKLSKVLSDVAIAIASDAAIETYCQTNFTKSVSVVVHIDQKNPPSISKCPWVGLTVQGYRIPSENNNKVMQFDVEGYVCCDDSGETTVGKVTTLDGFDTIEDLSDLVFDCIEKVLQTSAAQLDITIMDEGQTSLVISDFPSWLAQKTFTASKHV